MELRTGNVYEIWKECVLFSCGATVEFNEKNVLKYAEDIVSMLKQIATVERNGLYLQELQFCNVRKDGEQWTPYLQPVEQLILMGINLNLVVPFTDKLKKDTLLLFVCQCEGIETEDCGIRLKFDYEKRG